MQPARKRGITRRNLRAVNYQDSKSLFANLVEPVSRISSTMERVIRTKRVENAESGDISENIFSDLCLVFAWKVTYRRTVKFVIFGYRHLTAFPLFRVCSLPLIFKSHIPYF